jgi:hypothetical protein
MNNLTDNKQPKPTEVEFLLLKSLTDPRPIIVKRERLSTEFVYSTDVAPGL